MTRHLRSFAGGLAVTVLLCLGPQAGGQDENLRQFDPSDVYFQAWLQVREAEQAVKDEKFLEAYNTYNKAAKLFDTVALYHPEWKPHLVKDRQQSTRDSMGEIREKALAEQREEEGKLDGLVVEGPGNPMKVEEPGIKPLSPAERQKVSALQQQIRALNQQLAGAINDRNANAAQLRRALNELETERNRLSRAPLQGQVQDLNDRIGKVQRERDAMAAALQQSRGEYQNAVAQLALMQAGRDQAVQRAAQLENNLNIQKDAANDVVRGLRKQLADLKGTLEERDKQLSAANQRADSLERQLKESHAEIADLREERDALLKERDHMAALLALNETDRVKALIKQNMELGKELNEARDNLAKVVEDNNHTATELNNAKRDLVVAKARIIEINRENAAQGVRLRELEAKLREAGDELAAGARNGDVGNREEIMMLQGIIDRQLKLQKRRSHAKDLLMEQVKRLSIEDDQFTAALEMFAGQNLELTPEERKAFEDNIVDGEFVFGDHPGPQEREAAEGQLQRSIRVKTDLAQRAFAKGRLLVAREFFESVLDEHPGHVQSMLNLGVVNLRNNDPLMAIQSFNDAIAIRGQIPYAHFMLGVAYYQMTEYVRAQECLQTSLDGDPTNAMAHAYLGSIFAVSGEIAAAEKNFEAAIRLDPTLTEPFFNLAILKAREGNKNKALELYRKALENGAQPDLDFEKSISE
jgi:cytochrome c-type biogenesis protein CcmH/NrfG/uncharacterized coiled-coil DUF342 family protein